MKTLLLTACLALAACAPFQAKMREQPALRTALIAAGSALLVGAYERDRHDDPAPMQKIPREPCRNDRGECR